MQNTKYSQYHKLRIQACPFLWLNQLFSRSWNVNSGRKFLWFWDLSTVITTLSPSFLTMDILLNKYFEILEKICVSSVTFCINNRIVVFVLKNQLWSRCYKGFYFLHSLCIAFLDNNHGKFLFNFFLFMDILMQITKSILYNVKFFK